MNAEQAMMQPITLSRIHLEAAIESMQEAIRFADSLEDLHTSKRAEDMDPITKLAATEALGSMVRTTLSRHIDYLEVLLNRESRQ
jgi:hypothetical protein